MGWVEGGTGKGQGGTETGATGECLFPKSTNACVFRAINEAPVRRHGNKKSISEVKCFVQDHRLVDDRTRD